MSELRGLPVDIVVINSLLEEKDCFSWRLVMENGKGEVARNEEVAEKSSVWCKSFYLKKSRWDFLSLRKTKTT